MNEIVKFKADSGAMVEITHDDVVQYLCPTATVQEVGLFLQLCQAQRLNPWIGEAYLVKYGDSAAQMQVGKEAFTKRAAANPDYEGSKPALPTRTQAVTRDSARVRRFIRQSVKGSLAVGAVFM